jgi:uncharacterized protein with PQ loop repeat
MMGRMAGSAASLLKEGAKLTEKDEVIVFGFAFKVMTLELQAIARNIQACRELTDKVRTSMGPLGMKKVHSKRNYFISHFSFFISHFSFLFFSFLSQMIIDKHDKIYVTSDTASIVKELEIQHPAAKIVVMASQRQVCESHHFILIDE